jgi:hypothetical protein
LVQCVPKSKHTPLTNGAASIGQGRDFFLKKITATIFAQKRSASIADNAVEALLF